MSKVRGRILGWTIGLAAAIGLGALVYVQAVEPNLVPKNFGVVDEGKLYRSGALTSSATAKVVREHKIKTIIDLGGFDKDPTGEIIAERTASALHVDRHVFRLEGDGTGNPNAYVEALRIIMDPSKQPVLVHCSAGAQRTGGCVVLYRELTAGVPMDAGLKEATKYRHDPKDNPRLRPFLEQWRAPILDALKRGGLIEGQPKAEIVSPGKSALETGRSS